MHQWSPIQITGNTTRLTTHTYVLYIIPVGQSIGAQMHCNTNLNNVDHYTGV